MHGLLLTDTMYAANRLLLSRQYAIRMAAADQQMSAHLEIGIPPGLKEDGVVTGRDVEASSSGLYGHQHNVAPFLVGQAIQDRSACIGCQFPSICVRNK